MAALILNLIFTSISKIRVQCTWWGDIHPWYVSVNKISYKSLSIESRILCLCCQSGKTWKAKLTEQPRCFLLNFEICSYSIMVLAFVNCAYFNIYFSLFLKFLLSYSKNMTWICKEQKVSLSMCASDKCEILLFFNKCTELFTFFKIDWNVILGNTN